MPGMGRKPTHAEPQRHAADAGRDPAGLLDVRGGLPGVDGPDPLIARYLKALRYELRLQEARDDFLTFCLVMMPGEDPDNIDDSAFTVAAHHRYFAGCVQQIEAGKMLKTIFNAPPRHGKTLMMTTMFSAWYLGRHPKNDVMVATYNQDYAEQTLSSLWVALVTSDRFRQVFPEFALNPDRNSAGHRETAQGGNIYFLGRRSPTTGRGAHLLLCDDPTKDDKEARYESARNDAWDWFRKTLYTRRHNERCPLVVTQTRWSADDIVARISDPANLHYTEEFGSDFNIIHIPAIAVSKNDVMGRKIGEALWPEKFGTEELLKIRAADPVGFSCLYQSDPIPDEGVLFQPADLLEYDREELARLEPAMRIYCFSDHAYGTDKHHDPSCFAPVGVAPNGDAYFLPDIFWDRASPDDAVEKMLDMMKRRNPQRWFAENGGIFKSIEPFLTRRMQEEAVYCSIEAVWPKGTRKGAGKTERAAGALARCRMGRVKFPAFASWWPRAKAELLAFPNGNNDDFVDVLSLVGLQLDRIHARRLEPVKPKPQGMTWDWLMGEHERGPLDTRGWTGRA